MRAREVRELSIDELSQKERDLKEELFNLRFQLAMGQLENVARLSQVKHDIARIKTIQHEKRDTGKQ